jgi:hypothetical protein
MCYRRESTEGRCDHQHQHIKVQLPQLEIGHSISKLGLLFVPVVVSTSSALSTRSQPRVGLKVTSGIPASVLLPSSSVKPTASAQCSVVARPPLMTS